MGGKRPGWRSQRNLYNSITRQLAAEAKAEVAANRLKLANQSCPDGEACNDAGCKAWRRVALAGGTWRAALKAAEEARSCPTV